MISHAQNVCLCECRPMCEILKEKKLKYLPEIHDKSTYCKRKYSRTGWTAPVEEYQFLCQLVYSLSHYKCWHKKIQNEQTSIKQTKEIFSQLTTFLPFEFFWFLEVFPSRPLFSWLKLHENFLVMFPLISAQF